MSLHKKQLNGVAVAERSKPPDWELISKVADLVPIHPSKKINK